MRIEPTSDKRVAAGGGTFGSAGESQAIAFGARVFADHAEAFSALRTEYDAAAGAARTALEKKICLGRLALAIKRSLRHGEWEKWCQRKGMSLRTLRAAMLLVNRLDTYGIKAEVCRTVQEAQRAIDAARGAAETEVEMKQAGDWATEFEEDDDVDDLEGSDVGRADDESDGEGEEGKWEEEAFDEAGSADGSDIDRGDDGEGEQGEGECHRVVEGGGQALQVGAAAGCGDGGGEGGGGEADARGERASVRAGVAVGQLLTQDRDGVFGSAELVGDRQALRGRVLHSAAGTASGPVRIELGAGKAGRGGTQTAVQKSSQCQSNRDEPAKPAQAAGSQMTMDALFAKAEAALRKLSPRQMAQALAYLESLSSK